MTVGLRAFGGTSLRVKQVRGNSGRVSGVVMVNTGLMHSRVASKAVELAVVGRSSDVV